MVETPVHETHNIADTLAVKLSRAFPENDNLQYVTTPVRGITKRAGTQQMHFTGHAYVEYHNNTVDGISLHMVTGPVQ